MKTSLTTLTLVLCLVMGLAATASASVIVTQGAAAPTYATTLNFDESGGPTGLVSPDAWQATHGVSELQAGDGVPQVGDFATMHGVPWVGPGNAFYGSFGVFMKFEDDLSEMSLQVWDPSGPPSPFGGGLGVFVFDDGAEVTNLVGQPAWGGSGDSWFNITTTDGMVFDEVRVVGFGFPAETYADNMSWNVVPEPSSLALVAAGLLLPLFRRRR